MNLLTRWSPTRTVSMDGVGTTKAWKRAHIQGGERRRARPRVAQSMRSLKCNVQSAEFSISLSSPSTQNFALRTSHGFSAPGGTSGPTASA